MTTRAAAVIQSAQSGFTAARPIVNPLCADWMTAAALGGAG